MVKQVQGDSGKIYTYEDDVPDELILRDLDLQEKPAVWGDVIGAVPGEIKRGFGQLGAGVAKIYEDVTGQSTDSDLAMQAIQQEREAQLPKNMSLTQQGVVSGLASVPEMLGGLAAGVATGGAAIPLGFIGAMETAREYPEQRAGGMEPGRAAFHSAMSGAGEVAGEIAPLGFVVKNLGKVGAGKMLSGFLGRELLGEELTTAWQDINRKASINPDMTFQDWVKDAYVTGVATAVGGAAVSPVIAAVNRNTPESTDTTPRNVPPPTTTPPIVEAEPAEQPLGPVPPAPTFTDADTLSEPSKAQIAELEARVDAGFSDIQDLNTLNIQEIIRQNTSSTGLNAAKAADQIVQDVQNALDFGYQVTLYSDGKPVVITGTSRGMMQDASGQRWGTLALLTDPSGKLDNRLEFSGGLSETLLGEKLDEPVQQKPENSPLVAGLDDRQAFDTGLTNEVLRNKDNFQDPNTAVPRSDRRATRAKGVTGVVGKRFGEAKVEDFDTSQGPVVVQVGEDTDVRPAHYMKGVVEDIYALAQEFNPQGVYVILPEDTAVAGDKQAPRGGHFVQNGIHYIIPRWQTNQDQTGSHKTEKTGHKAGQYNSWAKLDAYSTLGHEFGHSLIEDFFYQGLTAQERTLMELSLKQGQPDAALAAKLSPGAQAILTEWAKLREATLTGQMDGRVFSGKEAALRWLSPSKLQSKALMKERFGFGGGAFTSQAFAKRGGVDYQLTLHEYLAEQVAKSMFSLERMGKSKTLEATFTYNKYKPEGILQQMEARIQEFLNPLLETLQNLYRKLTAMGMAGPATSTQEWLDQLSENAHQVNQEKVKAGKKAPARKKKVEAAPVVEPPVDYSNLSHQNSLRNALKTLREQGIVKTNSKHHRELAGMLNRGEWENFVTAIEPMLKISGGKISFDITADLMDGVERPGIIGKIESIAGKVFTELGNDGSILKKFPGNFGVIKGPLYTISVYHQEHGFVNTFLMTEQGIQEFQATGGNLENFRAGGIQDLMAIQDYSILEVTYNTEDKGISITAFPSAAYNPQMAEAVKTDKNSGMLQIKGTSWGQRLQLFGDTLARVRAHTGDYNTVVNWRRDSGAKVGKIGRALFEADSSPTANIGYADPTAQMQIGNYRINVVASSPLDTDFLLNAAGISGGTVQKVAVQVADPLVSVEEQLTADRVLALVTQAIAQGKDSVVVKGLNAASGPAVFTLQTRQITTAFSDPNIGARIRFDQSTPEGQEAASHWQLLREKLSLPHLSDAVAKFWALQWQTLQLQQIAHMNPQWTWIHNFSAHVQKFYRKVGQMHSRADAVVRQLHYLGKENLAKLQKFTLAEYRGGEHWTEIQRKDDQGHWEYVPTAKLYEQMKKFGIDPEGARGKRFVRLYIEAKNALQYQMDELQKTLYLLAEQKYSAPGMEAKLQQRRMEIALEFKLHRGRPFWPQHSFGKYRIQVWSTDAVGKVLLFESATDSETEWKQMEDKARAKYPGKTVKAVVQTADESLLMRLPVEFLDDLEVILGLDTSNPKDAEKLQQVREAMHSLYSRVPGQTYDAMRATTEGGSTDFIKVFADFSLRNSNFIAKMEYRKWLQTDIAQAQHDPENQRAAAKKAEISRAIDFMRGTVNYMMNPQEELTTIRGVVAIGYLWGNVKTAVLNLFALTHTWAALNRALGYGKGTVTFGKSVWDAGRTQGHEWGSFLHDVLAGAAEQSLVSVSDPTWEMVDGKPTELRLALEQAKSENVLDQSYAWYLASNATRGNLIRMASSSAPGKIFKGMVDSGMSLFRGTELLTRRATFIALYKAYQQNRPDLDAKTRYETVVKEVGLLQGDYTKGNRPQLMRGQIKSFLTIFMTFVQTASWNIYGGFEIGLKRQEAMEGRASPAFYRSYTMQLALLYLFMAGLEGLPGMENFMDLMDAMFKKWNNGKSARQGLRELLDELGLDPMTVVRGATFDLAGVDVSRSIGLGRIVPGTDVLAEEHGTTKEAIGAGVAAVSGVGGGYIQWLIDTIGAITDAVETGLPVEDTAAKQMARMPGGLGNMFKAAQWAKYDARGPAGGLVAFDQETGMAREIQSWEIGLKALGGQPASISQGQMIRAEQFEARAFWTARKKVLMDAYYQADSIAGDREAVADVMRAIGEFNAAVPEPKMKITRQKLRQSKDRRDDAVEKAEEFSTTQTSLEGLYQKQLESLQLGE